MFDPVKVGVVGIGRFGSLHAHTLSQLTESELVGLVDGDAVRLESVARRWPTVPRWKTIDEALINCSAEAWVVATSTASHIAVTKKLLAAGKTVLLEKPLAENPAAGQQLASWVSEDSSNLMLGHIVLFNSEFRELVRCARERTAIRYLDAVRHRSSQATKVYPHESPLHLLMTHDLYLALVLMGDREPEHFEFSTATDANRNMNLARATMQWKDGALVTLCASFLWPEKLDFEGFDRLEVYGDGWAGRIEPNPRPLTLWDERASYPLGLEILANGGPPAGMLAEELRCFCRVVRKLERVPLGARFEDGMRILQWQAQLQDASRRESNTVGQKVPNILESQLH